MDAYLFRLDSSTLEIANLDKPLNPHRIRGLVFAPPRLPSRSLSTLTPMNVAPGATVKILVDSPVLGGLLDLAQ